MRKQRSAWNKGRLLGRKPPLKPKEIWSLRIRLQLADKARDLALFNLAVDSNLHLVRLTTQKFATPAYTPYWLSVEQLQFRLRLGGWALPGLGRHLRRDCLRRRHLGHSALPTQGLLELELEDLSSPPVQHHLD